MLIRAGIISSQDTPFSGGPDQRWLPGTSRVAPFASVKSVIAHMQVHTMGGCGRARGISASSGWTGCLFYPGKTSIAEKVVSRQAGSSNPSTTGNTSG